MRGCCIERVFKIRQQSAYHDKNLGTSDNCFHSQAGHKVSNHGVVVGRVLAKEDGAFRWERQQRRLGSTEHWI
jgi:hypothetical protein